jgi:hypothetical protein
MLMGMVSLWITEDGLVECMTHLFSLSLPVLLKRACLLFEPTTVPVIQTLLEPENNGFTSLYHLVVDPESLKLLVLH